MVKNFYHPAGVLPRARNRVDEREGKDETTSRGWIDRTDQADARRFNFAAVSPRPQTFSLLRAVYVREQTISSESEQNNDNF